MTPSLFPSSSLAFLTGKWALMHLLYIPSITSCGTKGNWMQWPQQDAGNGSHDQAGERLLGLPPEALRGQWALGMKAKTQCWRP